MRGQREWEEHRRDGSEDSGGVSGRSRRGGERRGAMDKGHQKPQYVVIEKRKKKTSVHCMCVNNVLGIIGIVCI